MSWIDVESDRKGKGYYGQDLFLDILDELKKIRKLLEKDTKADKSETGGKK